MIRQAVLRIIFAFLLWSYNAGAEGLVRYLANEGVMVVHGEAKILFDPLFRNDYGQYQLVPFEMEQALLAGRPPFDDVDAVFISHYHGDHFSPADLMSFLRLHDSVHVYAPQQAVDDMQGFEHEEDPVLDRVTAVRLAYRDSPAIFEADGLHIEAVAIPHSGWPSSSTDVQNIAFRITMNDELTVLHMGDADSNVAHFAHDADFWSQRKLQLALPPYWYFLSAGGRTVLLDRLKPARTIGIHVPRTIRADPASRRPELREVDLFTQPGETRKLDSGDR